MTKRKGDAGPGASPVGKPKGSPRGPRRPDSAKGQESAPGQGENRPAPSLVNSSTLSTHNGPDLKARVDDIGRVFLYAPPMMMTPPTPPPGGPVRETRTLSRRAVRQIKGAAIKADMLGHGFKAFWTFTVAQEHRELFLAGERVLGSEVRRVLNALNQWFRRRGKPGLVYVWVAENIRNENPHVHLLTSHIVPRSEFDALAEHVEGLWGFGWVKVERVRNPKQAGRYMMKALAYSLKASEHDQGRVIGSRYGISRSITPRYETVELWDCAEARYELRRMQTTVCNGVVELGDGVWLTSHGVALSAGSGFDGLGHFIKRLERPSS